MEGLRHLEYLILWVALHQLLDLWRGLPPLAIQRSVLVLVQEVILVECNLVHGSQGDRYTGQVWCKWLSLGLLEFRKGRSQKGCLTLYNL